VLSTAAAYEGGRVAVRVDTIAMPDDSQATREVVVVDDAVAIVALDERQRACLLEQYRHPFGKRLLELPAGKIDVAGESPLATARRELGEEAKLRSAHWHELTCFLNSAGWSTERTHVFLAERVVEDTGNEFVGTGEEADLQVSMVPVRDALQMIDAAEIIDAKTIVGLLLAARRIGLV
jgi:8-oxo-dGTP pyrophosphatase MutT (NUDIX family)